MDIEEFVGQIIDTFQDWIDDYQWWNQLIKNDCTIAGSAYDVLSDDLKRLLNEWGIAKGEKE